MVVFQMGVNPVKLSSDWSCYTPDQDNYIQCSKDRLNTQWRPLSLVGLVLYAIVLCV